MSGPPSTALGVHLAAISRSAPEVIWLGLLNVLLVAALTLMMPSLFLSSENLASMAVQFPGYGLLALAMMAPMLTGGIDLSVVMIANLSAIAAAILMNWFVGPETGPAAAALIVGLCCGAALLVGIACGLINGLLIVFGISPILATLGSSLIFAGIAIVVTSGSAIVGLPPAFGWIGEGTPLGVPVPVIIFAGAALCLYLLLSKTAVGSNIYLVGANPVAARYAGIATGRVTLKVYVVSAACAVLAGLVISAKANSAKADYGSSYLLLSILICVLGGTNPAGGRGSVLGVILAVLALQLLSSGLNLMGVNNFAVDLVWGFALLVTLVISQRTAGIGR